MEPHIHIYINTYIKSIQFKIDMNYKIGFLLCVVGRYSEMSVFKNTNNHNLIKGGFTIHHIQHRRS